MKIPAWIYYLLDRRLGEPQRFDRLYRFDSDPFGCATYEYEKEKAANVLSALSEKRYAHLLDIGCGTGILTRQLKSCAEQITAVDFSSEAIEIAKENPLVNIQYHREDIRTVEFHTKYDLVLCSEVLYYLEKRDLELVVRRMKEILRSGTPIITVGKTDDKPVETVLERALELIRRDVHPSRRRPYAISLYSIPESRD